MVKSVVSLHFEVKTVTSARNAHWLVPNAHITNLPAVRWSTPGATEYCPDPQSRPSPLNREALTASADLQEHHFHQHLARHHAHLCLIGIRFA
ncbi:MAG: hypothetical protein KDA52_18925, partial [Planctomycetaceae bacterium]|nr:hypothetical protein [Planctomycetaceae bacterium]